MNKQVLIGLSTLSLVTILSGVALSSSNSSAASATATASVKVASACTMSISGGGSYSATIPNGTSSEITGSTFSVTCNDANGFALYAVGNSNNTLGNSNLIGASTNIATNTSGTDSYWAMKINPATGTTPTIENSFNNYHIVPNAHTKVASYSGSTGTGSLSVNATYKANISSTQLAGNYLGKVKYTLIHPATGPAPVTPLAASDCPANSICYAPNADDIVGSMDSISSTKITTSPTAGVQTTVSGYSSTSITSNSEIVLIAPNFSRDGYGFAGWSTDYDAAATYAADSNADITIFGPNQTITTSTSGTGDADVSTNGLILYPVWIASIGTIQNWNANGTNCSSLTTAPTATKATLASVTALTDNRDGNVYTVARLADGNCWMTENLRIDAEATRGNSNQALAQGYGDDTANNRGKFIGLAKSENANFTYSSTVANSLYSTDGSTEINIGTANNPDYRIPRYNNNNTNRFLAASYNGAGDTTYYQWYGYGNYYNWPAAIANTTYNPVRNQSTTGTSLCPTGWRLPQGGDKTRIESDNDNDFWTLIVTNLNGGTNPSDYDYFQYPYYTGSTEGPPVSKLVRQFPNNFVYSGYFVSSSANYRSSEGYYWSSTAFDFMSSYHLELYSYHTVDPGTGSLSKVRAQSIRCVAGS